MEAKQYKHLFFDLDRTLWDFEKNSSEAISELFEVYGLEEKLNVKASSFILVYKELNHQCWKEYREGLITKDQLRLKRYHESFKYYGLEDKELALRFNDDYIATCSVKPHLIPHTKEVLDYLAPNYQLHIITNGFVEAQYTKLEKSGLSNYFDAVIVSDGFGYRKPDKRIFYHALEQASAHPQNSLMIGDDYGPDIEGARGVGIDQVYFSAEGERKEATHCIQSLLELKGFL